MFHRINKLKVSLLIIAVSAITVVTSGCASPNSKVAAIDGGVFKTVNQGLVWQHKDSLLTTSGQAANFAVLNVASMVMDPSDDKTIYYGSVGGGLIYTYDGGESWQVDPGFNTGTVRAIAVDPNAKCTVFTAATNKVYKSNDCVRSWSQVYVDNTVTVTVDAITVDPANSKNVYIGVSRGDIIKSTDGGESWQTIARLKTKIDKIIIDPNDSRIMYAILDKRGVMQSTDSGVDWTAFNDGLTKNKLGLDVKNVVLIPDKPNVIFLACSNGLLRSDDSGVTWTNINIIPPGQGVAINSLAVNPQNPDDIYYVTNTTFNRSLDGGTNWTPSNLPTTRAGTILLLDPKVPNTIYLGVFGSGK